MTTVPDCARHQQRAGFTLIEVMVALVLSASVAGISASVAVQSFRSVDTARSVSRLQWEQMEVMQQFETDLRSMLSNGPPQERLMINTEQDQLLQVLGLTEAPTTESLFRRRLPGRIRYFVEADNAGPGLKRLVREVVDLTDPDEHHRRRVVARQLGDVQVEWLTTGDWSPGEWKLAEDNVQPTAVRLKCRWAAQSGEVMTRTVLLSEAWFAE